MKILINYQHYWPENFRITDIAETLVTLGNDVTVLCGLPNYPKGYVLDEYKHGKNRIQERNGVKIIRAKEIGRRKGPVFRLLNYWSYPHYAKKLLNKLDRDFDVVYIQMTSPIMMAKPGIEYGKRFGKKVLMYEMDLWPESLLAGGISNKSLIYKHYKKVSTKIYSSCDKILTSTKEHIDYIKKLSGCNNLDIECLEQYGDTVFEEANFKSVDNGVIDLMFAGNIGKAQSLDTVIKAASILKDDNRFKFHIVGSGSELDNIKKLANELKLDNVIFYGQKPIEEMPNLYSLADAMLVTLEDKSYANMTIPGKVQSYMASGKAIIGAINGSTANFIKDNNIGYVCPSEDSVALANLIKTLDIKELSEIGKRSKEIYFEKYCKEKFFAKLINDLKELSNK
ncbi:MAG: glycosyltransferase family 4 protein [Bacilli bacterium]|nr:glycosyltransferase family 4 protein [Bacilli bacterium]